jgi:capsid portal protein
MNWSLVINPNKPDYLVRRRCTSGDNAKKVALAYYKNGSHADFLITANDTNWARCDSVDAAGRLKWRYL